LPAPTLYPATVEVDFTEIPLDRCNPALDGLFVSHQGAIDLVRGMRRTEHDYQVQAIQLESEKNVCQFDLKQTKAELDHTSDDKTWAWVGKLGVAGIVVGAVVAGVAIIYHAVKP
jgi:hypothetical protein